MATKVSGPRMGPIPCLFKPDGTYWVPINEENLAQPPIRFHVRAGRLRGNQPTSENSCLQIPSPPETDSWAHMVANHFGRTPKCRVCCPNPKIISTIPAAIFGAWRWLSERRSASGPRGYVWFPPKDETRTRVYPATNKSTSAGVSEGKDTSSYIPSLLVSGRPFRSDVLKGSRKEGTKSEELRTKRKLKSQHGLSNRDVSNYPKGELWVSLQIG